MCIFGLWFNTHPDIPFVACHNRDEVLSRDVEPPHAEQKILFGRDLSGGGTWMGYNRETGVFAALTNVRASGHPTSGVSRGQLVLSILQGEGPVTIDVLQKACSGKDPHPTGVPAAGGISIDLGDKYAGFNLVVAKITATTSECYFLTNRPPKPYDTVDGSAFIALGSLEDTAMVWRLADGIHAFSNSTLDDFMWGKVRWLSEQLTTVKTSLDVVETSVDSTKTNDEIAKDALSRIIPIITSQTPLADDLLMSDLSWSSLPAAHEKHLQKFVFLPIAASYGTRATTIILQVRDTIYYCYRSFDPVTTKETTSTLTAKAQTADHTSTVPTPNIAGDVTWKIFTSPAVTS